MDSAASVLPAELARGRWLGAVLSAVSISTASAAAESAPKAEPVAVESSRQTWAEWVERDFPFYSAMVYAEQPDPPLLAENRVARGLVLNLGANLWACFDLELLRVAAVWEGEVAKTYSNAAFSYDGDWPTQRSRQARSTPRRLRIHWSGCRAPPAPPVSHRSGCAMPGWVHSMTH